MVRRKCWHHRNRNGRELSLRTRTRWSISLWVQEGGIAIRCDACGEENDESSKVCARCGSQLGRGEDDLKVRTNAFLVFPGWAGSVISFTYELFIISSILIWAGIGIMILIVRTHGLSFEHSMVLFAVLLALYLFWICEGRKHATGP